MGGQTEAGSLLDKIGHVHGHLLHGGVVECLNVPQCSLVILGYHVNGYSLSAETTSPTDPVKNKKGSPSLQISSAHAHVGQRVDVNISFACCA